MTSIKNNPPNKKPPLELRLRVLSAIDYAPGNSIQARIKNVSKRILSMSRADVNISSPGEPLALGFIGLKNTASPHWTTKPARIKTVTEKSD